MSAGLCKSVSLAVQLRPDQPAVAPLYEKVAGHAISGCALRKLMFGLLRAERATHSVTVPSMQVIVSPPTQMSVPSRRMWIRPLRPSAVPWLAM